MISPIGRCALACAALLIPAACTGSQIAPGTSSAGPVSAAFSRVTHASWISPDARRRDLLYVSDFGAGVVDVFTYPRAKKVGELTGFMDAASLCSDRAGDIFVVQNPGPVEVYAHGGSTPIRQLTTQGTPEGCAVDPTTGNVALTNETATRYGAVTIYPNGSGSGKVYTDDQVVETLYCGYDNKGNLFIDGYGKETRFVLLELPKGGKRFHITTLQNFNDLGGVEWDGRYVAVADNGAGLIYRIDPTTDQVAQVVHLSISPSDNNPFINQFWIRRKTMVGTNYKFMGSVSLWAYPAGGDATKTVTGFDYPTGAIVSVAGS